MSNETRRLDAWIAADRAAHSAARELLDRRVLFIRGMQPKPSEDDVARVQHLREEAARLYKFAIDELDEIAARSEDIFAHRPR